MTRIEFNIDLESVSMKKYDLAKKLGMTYPTLRAKIRDKDKFTVGELKKLSELGFTVDQYKISE